MLHLYALELREKSASERDKALNRKYQTGSKSDSQLRVDLKFYLIYFKFTGVDICG